MKTIFHSDAYPHDVVALIYAPCHCINDFRGGINSFATGVGSEHTQCILPLATPSRL